jgi:hypothetical protein
MLSSRHARRDALVSHSRTRDAIGSMRRVHSCSVFERRHGDAAMFVRRTTTWGIARQPASGTSIRASGPEDPAQPNGSHDGDGGAHVAMRCFIARARVATHASLPQVRRILIRPRRPTVREERAPMRTNETAPRNRSAEAPRPSGPGRLPRVGLAEHGRQRLLRFVAADDDVERVGQTQNAREVAVPRIGVKES